MFRTTDQGQELKEQNQSDHQASASKFLDQLHHQSLEHVSVLRAGGNAHAGTADKQAPGESAQLHVPNLWDESKQAVTGGLEQANNLFQYSAEKTREAGAHAAPAIGHGAEELWKGMDKNGVTHWIKHDLCNDNPLEVGVVGTIGVLTAAAVALPLETGIAGAAASVAIFGGIPIGIDYVRRHLPRA